MTSTVVAVRKPTILIRNPVARWDLDAGAPAFTLERPLAGTKVGLRHEGAWRSWMLISAIWADRLEAEGATSMVLETGERVGHEGEQTRGRIAGWAADVDCAISGLGTCGSCTTWTVHDAVSVEALGKPAIAAVCEEFVPHARNIATYLGHPNLKILTFPYPLEARPEAELRQIAVDWWPKFLALLGATA
jgi:hypothetical protein